MCDISDFPRSVLDYWHTSFAWNQAVAHGIFSLSVSDRLSLKRPAMLLAMPDGTTRAVVYPEIATRMGMQLEAGSSVGDLKRSLGHAGVTLHDPDYLFYYPLEEPQRTVSCLRKL